MLIAIQQPEFFPWIGYLDKIKQVDKIVLLDNVQFKKRYFENRNKVRTRENWTWIRVPVKVKGRYTQLINDVEIDNSQDWQSKLIGTLKHCYKQAPFWVESGGEELCEIVAGHKYHRLIELNLTVIYFLMEKFGVTKETVLASEIETNGKGSELILNICKITGADGYLSGRDGVNYLDSNIFERESIALTYQKFVHPVYKQYASDDFVEAMSSIDLLFNVGPLAIKNIN
jgi:hypothetical protein